MGRKQFENNTIRQWLERHPNILNMGKGKPYLGSRDGKGESPLLQPPDIKENTSPWKAHKED